MLKKSVIFIIIFLLFLFIGTLPVYADANKQVEIVDFSVIDASDDRFVCVNVYPGLCYYMYEYYKQYSIGKNYETGEENEMIYFSMVQTELCQYKIENFEEIAAKYNIKNVSEIYISRIIENPQTFVIMGEPIFSEGYSISDRYKEFVYPHNQINARLIAAGVNDNRYKFEDDFELWKDKKSEYTKVKIDIGKETIDIYLKNALTDEQVKELSHDNMLDTSTIYIIICMMCGVALIGSMMAIRKRKEHIDND